MVLKMSKINLFKKKRKEVKGMNKQKHNLKPSRICFKIELMRNRKRRRNPFNYNRKDSHKKLYYKRKRKVINLKKLRRENKVTGRRK